MSPTNLILLLTSLVSLTLVFQVALAGLLFLSWRRFKIDEKSIRYTARKTSKQLTDLVIDAQKESKDLLLESQRAAHDQLANLPDYSAILEKESHQVIQELIKWQETELKRLHKSWTEKIAGATASSQHEMEEHMLQALDSFNQELSLSLKKHLELLAEERAQLKAETQTQLKNYTEEQKKELASQVEKALPQVFKGILQKQLSPAQQHELVMTQLQQAWEEGILKV